MYVLTRTQIHFTHIYISRFSTDALETVQSMLSAGKLPSQLAITRLVQALGSQGDVEGVQEVQSLMKDHHMTLNLSNMLFVNNTALAHIKK